jgi:hypothetical protein
MSSESEIGSGEEARRAIVDRSKATEASVALNRFDFGEGD